MLPTKKTPPRTNLNDLTIFIYGPHKFGKSTWCSKAEDALFLATEAGLNSLEVFQQPIGTWDDLLAAAKEIAGGKHPFRTVVLDTVDNAYKMCTEYICQKFKIEHESDLEYGKGYALVNNEFYRVLNKLALLPYGLFLVSHSHEKEIETRTGKYTRVVPTLPDKARKLVLGMVDIILFCDLEQTKEPDGEQAYRRVLRTKPSTTYEAGDRTGRLPNVIDLDFAAFAAAFARPSVPTGAPTTAQAPPSNAVGAATPGSQATTATTAAPPTTTPPAATPAAPPATTPTTPTTTTPPAATPAAPPATTPAPPATTPATPVATRSGGADAAPRASAAATTTSAPRSTTSAAKPRSSATTR